MKKRKRGFTLVELLVVIAILAVLATISILGYSAFTKKADISNDQVIISQMNLALQSNETLGDGAKYEHQAIQQCIEAGFILENLTPSTTGYHYAYDQANNRFMLLDEDYEFVFGVDNHSDIKTSSWLIYVVVASQEEINKAKVDNKPLSVYLREGYKDTSATVSAGIDVGDNKTIKSITYSNNILAKDVLIRTNSFETNITINAPLDHVSHYGSAGVIDIQKIATTSFWEYGISSFIELNIGRIVLTEASDVEIINVTKKDANTYNNPIIADGGVLEYNMPDIISRDQVDVTDESGKTPLVQVQKIDTEGNVIGIVEQVYAYANGTAGTTERTGTQNSNISSKLGIIVLDGGGNAGEKAYNTATKEAKKEESVEISIRASKYGGGRGTPEDPFIISSIEHLYAMSEDYQYNELVEEYCNFECYKLVTDLTVENWTIGTIHYIKTSDTGQMPYCNAFGGQFDGNGHTIKFIWNRDQDVVDENDGVALFGEFIDSLGIEGYDRPGVMKNLTIDCDIDSVCNICPMFAYIWGDDCTIQNCKIKGKIKGDGWFAGISLYANNYCLIKDCVVEADFIANLQQDTKWSTNYYYLSTFINQTILNIGKEQIVFDNCKVNGSITLPYCSKITEIRYGTFYAKNRGQNCIGIDCVDNCIVNIAEGYTTADAKIIKATLDVNP